MAHILQECGFRETLVFPPQLNWPLNVTLLNLMWHTIVFVLTVEQTLTGEET
jgi:hypothetical protein